MITARKQKDERRVKHDRYYSVSDLCCTCCSDSRASYHVVYLREEAETMITQDEYNALLEAVKKDRLALFELVTVLQEKEIISKPEKGRIASKLNDTEGLKDELL